MRRLHNAMPDLQPEGKPNLVNKFACSLYFPPILRAGRKPERITFVSFHMLYHGTQLFQFGYRFYP